MSTEKNNTETETSHPKVDPKRKAKIEQLTGRRDSVKSLECYLYPENAEEALQFGKSIEKSDKIKKVFGQRPNVSELPTNEGQKQQ
jgi:hypothetical protein